MRKYIYLSILAITLGFSSCSVFENINMSSNLKKAPALIESVIPTAVRYGIDRQPKSKPYLVALATVIDGFALGKDLSPVALRQAIKTLKVKELETPEALAVVDSVVNLYKVFFDAAVVDKIATVENLTPILNALSKAIVKGLE